MFSQIKPHLTKNPVISKIGLISEMTLYNSPISATNAQWVAKPNHFVYLATKLSILVVSAPTTPQNYK